ncbi:MAG: hypothetical protein FDZ69_13740 [Deltaproteobacteria bacterium]|nr:MAG: hypothetical protein FDZ69_13740 [Deltaproteobacteria bacterium]
MGKQDNKTGSILRVEEDGDFLLGHLNAELGEELQSAFDVLKTANAGKKLVRCAIVKNASRQRFAVIPLWDATRRFPEESIERQLARMAKRSSR